MGVRDAEILHFSTQKREDDICLALQKQSLIIMWHRISLLYQDSPLKDILHLSINLHLGGFLSTSGDSGMLIVTYTFNRRNISYLLINSIIQFSKTISELELI